MRAALRDAMTRNVVVARASDSAEYVRRLMFQHGISRVVIVSDSSHLMGIVTHKDIVWYELAEDTKDLHNVAVLNVMNKPVIWEQERRSLPACAAKMLAWGISSLAAMEGGRLTGILTKTDLCRYYAGEQDDAEAVADWMSGNLVTEQAAHRLIYAAWKMEENRVGRIPIVNRRLEGILTYTDLTAIAPALTPGLLMANPRMLATKKRFVKARDPSRILISDVMTRNPLTVADGSSLSLAAKAMVDHRISGLPVTDSADQLVGIVTKTDITRAIATNR